MIAKHFLLTKHEYDRGNLILDFIIYENENVAQILKYPIGGFTMPFGVCYIGNRRFDRDDYASLEVARETWREAIQLGWKPHEKDILSTK